MERGHDRIFSDVPRQSHVFANRELSRSRRSIRELAPTTREVGGAEEHLGASPNDGGIHLCPPGIKRYSAPVLEDLTALLRLAPPKTRRWESYLSPSKFSTLRTVVPGSRVPKIILQGSARFGTSKRCRVPMPMAGRDGADDAPTSTLEAQVGVPVPLGRAGWPGADSAEGHTSAMARSMATAARTTNATSNGTR